MNPSCLAPASGVSVNEGKEARRVSLQPSSDSQHSQSPAPFLKKSPHLVGQDVHVVFAMFSQSNTGVYLFREISVGHFRSHCRPLAPTFGAHPQAVTSHPRPHFPACNPPSLIQFSTNKACCLLTPLPRLAEKAHRLGKHNSHSHGGNSHCPWLVWCMKLSQVRAHSDFPDFCFRLLCS